MKLYAKTPIQFIGLINKTAKDSGTAFQLAAFGNPATFERFEFFVNDAVDYNQLSEGDLVNVEYEVTRSGYRTNINVARILPVKDNA